MTRDIVGEKSHLQEERSRRIQSRRPPEGGAAASWRKSKLQPRKFHKKLLQKRKFSLEKFHFVLCCSAVAVLTSGKSLLMLSSPPFPLLYIVQPRPASGKTTNKFQRGGRHRCSIRKTHMLIVNTGGPLHRFREYVTEPERQRAERPSLSDAYKRPLILTNLDWLRSSRMRIHLISLPLRLYSKRHQ